MSVLTMPGSSTTTEAHAYTAALFDLVGESDPVVILSQTPAAVEALVTALSDDQLIQPEEPGKWSMRDVVQHLADVEIVGGMRLRLVLAQDRPPLTGIDQDLWASRLRYQDVAVRDALEQFTVLRRVNLRLWKEASPVDLERIGMHSERGEESLERLRRIYAGHDRAHLQQLERIRKVVT